MLGTPRSLVLGYRQRHRGLLGAPLVVGYYYVSLVCYQAAPCYLDQGADLGQHVWGLDTCMLDDVSKLLDFFSLTLLQDSFFIL